LTSYAATPLVVAPRLSVSNTVTGSPTKNAAPWEIDSPSSPQPPSREQFALPSQQYDEILDPASPELSMVFYFKCCTLICTV